MVWKKMVKVYNVKTEDHTCSKNNFYIGRGSPLGNPFGVKGKRVNYAKLTVPTREEAIEEYKLYFREMYGKDNELTKYFDEIYEHYKNGEDVYLQCFCKPLPCHGDFIAEELQRKLVREKLAERKKSGLL